jgi:hypothetical protein
MLAQEAELRLWRDLGKLAVVAAFFGVCFAMLASVIGFGSPWLGLLLMFYFMALAKVAEPLFTFRLPAALRAVDARHGLYRWLGVDHFGALLRNSPLRYLNASVYLASGRQSLAALSRQVASSEAIHFWAAVLFAPYIAYVGSRGLMAETGFFVLVQIVFNLYPILHLRIVRARLARYRIEDL